MALTAGILATVGSTLLSMPDRLSWLRRLRTAVVLAFAAGIATACSNEAAPPVKIGMKEQQVRELLGEPTYVITDKVDVRGYLSGAREGCATGVRI
jgi:hypothetical protein